jgi:hypothetical protein
MPEMLLDDHPGVDTPVDLLVRSKFSVSKPFGNTVDEKPSKPSLLKIKNLIV